MSLRLWCSTFLLSGAVALAQSSPVPFLNGAASPDSTAPGSQAQTITLTGGGFAPGVVAYWKQTSLSTNRVSSSRLTAVIPANLLATAGATLITVANPSGVRPNGDLFVVSSPTTPDFTLYADLSSNPVQGMNLTSALAADVNGDGKLDIVGVVRNEIYLLIGNGDGSFQSPQMIPVDAYSNAIVSGDFNGDGKLDFALGANPTIGSSLIPVALSNGDGTFQVKTTTNIDLQHEPVYLASGDVNGDGKLDLVTANSQTAGFSVFLGNGQGAFSAPVDYSLADPVGSVAVSDVNGDGILDVVVSTIGQQPGFSVSLGVGDGIFGTSTSYPLGYATSAIVLTDVNGDGKPDLVAVDQSSPGNLHVRQGSGDGTFGPDVSYPTGETTLPLAAAVGDFNADGLPDIAVSGSGSVSIFFGNRTGTFNAAVNYPSSSYGGPILPGDFNGDGALDLFETPTDSKFFASVLLQGELPIISVNVDQLTFTPQAVGTQSLPQTVTITNTGKGPLSISEISISGDGASSYTQTNNCQSEIAPQASCQVSVIFSPEMQGGDSATLNVADNAPGGVHTVGLGGSAAPQAMISLSTNAVSFPGQYVGSSGLPQNITITNNGNAPLTISGAVSNSPDFAVTNACGGNVAPGTSCSIAIFFDPTAAGARTGTVTLTDNAVVGSTSISVMGEGEDFSIAPTPSSQTLSSSGTASYALNLNPAGGFTGTVALTCSGVPSGLGCTLSQNAVTLSGSAPLQLTLNIQPSTTVASISAEHETGWRELAGLSAACCFPVVLLWGRRKNKLSKIWMVLVVIGVSAMMLAPLGCGGAHTSTSGSSGAGNGGSPTPATPGTYTLVVNGTSSSGAATLNHSMQVQLVVQ